MLSKYGYNWVNWFKMFCSIVDEAKESSFEEIDIILEGKTKEDKIKAYGLLLERFEKVNSSKVEVCS